MQNDFIIKYINEVQPEYDGVLYEIQQEALTLDIPIIPNETARFLSFLLTVKKPKRILEIGCAVGFSAGLMSRYLEPGGEIITVDRYDYMIEQARINFKRMGIEDTVTLIEGDAIDILPSLSGVFDVIFLDASKAQYIYFLPHLMKLLPVSGILITDDVLQHGDVAKPKEKVERRQKTIHKRLNSFLYEITHMEELETCILPIGDGLTLSYKKK